jgi:hypothetical protein
MLTHETVQGPNADRATQRALLVALGASRRTLRRDECGVWRIGGCRGHIYTWGPSGGWLLFCNAGTARKWSAIKRQLSFCSVTQDCDVEGCLRLFELPTSEQAVQIRKALGLRRKRTVDGTGTSETIFSSVKRGVSGAPASARRKGGVEVHPEATEKETHPNTPLIEAAE